MLGLGISVLLLTVALTVLLEYLKSPGSGTSTNKVFNYKETILPPTGLALTFLLL